NAIAVVILQEANTPEILLTALRVAPHFSDEEASALIESHRHGIFNTGFSGNEFETKARYQLEGIQCFLSGNGGYRRQIFGIEFGFLSGCQAQEGDPGAAFKKEAKLHEPDFG